MTQPGAGKVLPGPAGKGATAGNQDGAQASEPFTVVSESFEAVHQAWLQILPSSATNTIFVTPQWQQLWWRHFGGERDLEILSIRDTAGALMAIAPLRLGGRKMALVGNTDVCDYSDFIVSEANAPQALPVLLSYLSSDCWDRLVLHSLPADSPTLALMPELARERGWSVVATQENVCPRAELPVDWDTYLGTLNKKDRHELRRKFRRLEAAGDVRYYRSADSDRDMEDFIRLHTASREDKAVFMTPKMEAFFREAVRLPYTGLYFLEVDGVRAASIICFDYNESRLLYNSGYDPRFSSLSAGLLLKAWALREAIERGMKCFDFLRGDEPYKYDLGGTDYPIYQLVVGRDPKSP